MAALIRCAFRRCLVLGNCYSKSLILNDAINAAVVQNARCIASMQLEKDKIVIEIHKKIDRNQGISKDLFNKLYSIVENRDKVTDRDVGLLLHILSLGPYDAPVKERIQMTEDVWSKLPALGVEPSTKLYNVKLKSYCANKKDFTPIDELVKLKSLQLNPDKVTYGFLIEGFCQQGDINGANMVLEAMKEGEMLLGVSVFNSFITGHFKAGSPEEAENILAIIKERGLSPNADTYLRFATYYAEQGDVDSVLKYLEILGREQLFLDSNSLLELYKVMVINGHGDKTEEIISFASGKGIFQSDSIAKSWSLASEGFTQEALQLYLSMPKMENDLPKSNAGSFLLKAMIQNGQGAEEVMRTADELMLSVPNSLPHRNAVFYAYKSNRTDLAMELIHQMNSKNLMVKIPLIIPAVCQYRDQNNLDGVYRATEMLLGVTQQAYSEEKCEKLYRCCYPALQKCGQSREAIVNRLQHEKTWNFLFFIEDLEKHGLEKALENVSGKQVDMDMAKWPDLNSIIFQKLPSQWEQCIEVLNYLNKCPGGDKLRKLSLNGDALLRLLTTNDMETTEQFLDAMKEKNLRVMQKLATVDIVKSSSENIFNSWQTGPPKDFSYQAMNTKTDEELEEIEKRYPELFIPKLISMNRANACGDAKALKQKLREIQAMGFTLNRLHLLRTIGGLTRMGEVEAAVSCFEDLKKLSGTKYPVSIPLNIARKMVENGDVQGALQMVEMSGGSGTQRGEKNELQVRYTQMAIVKAAPTVEDAKVLHRALFQTLGLVMQNDALSLHREYITKVMESCDDDELVQRLLELHSEFDVFPCMDAILTRFIHKQDVERLKKVMDLGISVIGSNLFHHKLAANFIVCGLPSKAMTILQTPGLKINSSTLVNSCQYFIKTKQIQALESLVNISESLPVSRILMLRQLIEGYVAVDDLPKAAEVLGLYEESFQVPPKDAVDFLVSSFRKKNLELPHILQTHLSNREAAKKYETSTGIEAESSSSSSLELESEKPKEEQKQDDTRPPEEREDKKDQSTVDGR